MVDQNYDQDPLARPNTPVGLDQSKLAQRFGTFLRLTSNLDIQFAILKLFENSLRAFKIVIFSTDSDFDSPKKDHRNSI